MSTIVYLLWHDDHDYDSTRWLRGIYSNEAEALKDLPVEGVEITYLSTRDRQAGIGEYCETDLHDDNCCLIEQHKIRDHAIGAVALPERPHVPLTGGRLISEAMEGYLRDMFTDIPIYHGPLDAPDRPEIFIYPERSESASHED